MPKPKTSSKAPFIQSIVHATDFSAADERAFAHALGVALLLRAELTILHVASDGRPDWHAFPAVRKTLERWKLLEPGSSQEAVFKKLGVAVAKVGLKSRFPALAVAQHLERAPAELLVVATEGREGVARWLQGSVAEAMARWSGTMTLFVPADSQRNVVALADGNLTLENVLIPVDRTPDPSAAIEFARRAAAVMSDKKATITLLHVGDGKELPSMHADDGPQ
ncbi:MAG TPA: universal stress protein, partial [Gammaproteobacteria bacterium]|nr:universal stress protein [Gammaproteobacteria bacterium]